MCHRVGGGWGSCRYSGGAFRAVLQPVVGAAAGGGAKRKKARGGVGGDADQAGWPERGVNRLAGGGHRGWATPRTVNRPGRPPPGGATTQNGVPATVAASQAVSRGTSAPRRAASAAAAAAKPGPMRPAGDAAATPTAATAAAARRRRRRRRRHRLPHVPRRASATGCWRQKGVSRHGGHLQHDPCLRCSRQGPSGRYGSSAGPRGRAGGGGGATPTSPPPVVVEDVSSVLGPDVHGGGGALAAGVADAAAAVAAAAPGGMKRHEARQRRGGAHQEPRSRAKPERKKNRDRKKIGALRDGQRWDYNHFWLDVK